MTMLLFLLPGVMAQDTHDHDDDDDHVTDTIGTEGEGHDDHDDDEHDDHDEDLVVELSPEAIEMAGLALSEVSLGRIGNTIYLPGEVGFNEDRLVHIAPRFAGIAGETKCRVGDYVNANDVVAVIESNESMTPYSIKAPISGWVIERHVTPGEFVSEENSIYVIADLTTVWVNLAVYPKDADQIKTGLDCHITAIGSDAETDGVIQYVTPVLDVRTRSITARVVLPNPSNNWRPGIFVQARVSIGTGDVGLVVEKDAVQILHEEHVVFVADGPGRFRPVDVTPGESDSHHVRILAGLERGIEYVSRGAFELKAKIITSSLDSHAGHGH